MTGEEEQEFLIEVPVGHVTVIYLKADGSRADDSRCFLERQVGDRYQSDSISHTSTRIPLVPGSYRVKGWSQVGDFDLVDFEIEVGDEKEVVLRNKRAE